MSDNSLDVRHETFSLSRRFDATPATVFAAFADPGVRPRWFRLPGSGATSRHAFAVGAGETASSTFNSPDSAPERLEYRSRYIDIVDGRRIVFVSGISLLTVVTAVLVRPIPPPK